MSNRTSVIFEPGNPPTTTAPARARRGQVEGSVDAVPEVIQRNAKPPIPTWLTSVASSAISSACDCLSIQTPILSTTQLSTSTVAVVTTVTIIICSFHHYILPKDVQPNTLKLGANST